MEFGRYELLERINEGHLSESFLALPLDQSDEDGAVVLRRVLPSLLENQRVVELFREETRITERLDHINLVRVLLTGEVESWPFFVTEHVDGIVCSKLVQRCAQSGTELSLSECAYVTSRLLLAQESIHRATDDNGDLFGLVHGEVGTERVYIGRDGRIRLDALGAGSQQQHNLRASVAKGKAQSIRLAPEQILGRTFDHRIDIFNAGVFLAELLIQSPLFTTGNQLSTLLAIRDVQLTALEESSRRLPPKLEKVLRRALSKEPDDRYRSASEMARELSGFFGVLTGEELQSGLGEIVTEALAIEEESDKQYEASPAPEIRHGSTPSWYPTANQPIPRVRETDESELEQTADEADDSKVGADHAEETASSQPLDIEVAEEEAVEEEISKRPTATPSPDQVLELEMDGWTMTPTPSSPPPRVELPVGRRTLRSTAPPPAARLGQRPSSAPTPRPDAVAEFPYSSAPSELSEAQSSRPSEAPTPIPVLIDEDPPSSSKGSVESESGDSLDINLEEDFWSEESSETLAVPDAINLDDIDDEAPDAGLTTQTLVIASVMFRRADGQTFGPFNFPAALDKVYGGEFAQTDEASIDGKPFKQLKNLSEFSTFVDTNAVGDAAPVDEHRPSRPFDVEHRPSWTTDESASSQPTNRAAERASAVPDEDKESGRSSSQAPRRRSRPSRGVRRPSWPNGSPAKKSKTSRMPQHTPRPSDPPSRRPRESTTPRVSSWPAARDANTGRGSEPRRPSESRRPSDPPVVVGEPESVDVELEEFSTESAEVDRPESGERSLIRLGALDVEPVSRVLYGLFTSRASRRVVFEHGPIRKEIRIEYGAPVDVSSNIASETFSEYLVRSGSLSQMELEMALAMSSKFDDDLGQSLVGIGLFEAEELETHIRAHLSSAIQELIAWSKGEYRIFPASAEASPGTRGLDIIMLLWDAIVDRTPAADIDRWFDEHQHDIVIPHEDMEPLFSTPELPTPARRMLRLLKSPRPMNQLIEAHGGQRLKDKRNTALALKLADELALVDIKGRGQ